MKNVIIFIFLLVASISARMTVAQSIPALVASALNPLSLALTVGQWMMKGSQRVYYIRVEAMAPNAELAKQEALRLAVNQAAGTLVLTETKIENQELVRQDLAIYSSGFVEEFKLLYEAKVGDQTRLVMDVWVAESKIANRLFAISRGEGVIDGPLAATQYQSILEERKQGDRIIQMIANDFPQKAFTVKTGKLSWRMLGRNVEILVPAEMSWNKDYMEAMYEGLVQTRNGNQAANQRYQKNWPAVVSIKRPSDWFTTYASYADTKKVALLKERMIWSLPTVQILIKNLEGQVLHSACATIPHLSGAFHGGSLAFGVYPTEKFGYPTGQFFAADSPDADFSIYGDFKINTTFRLPMQVNPMILNAMQAIEINVVPKARCQKVSTQEI